MPAPYINRTKELDVDVQKNAVKDIQRSHGEQDPGGLNKKLQVLGVFTLPPRRDSLHQSASAEEVQHPHSYPEALLLYTSTIDSILTGHSTKKNLKRFHNITTPYCSDGWKWLESSGGASFPNTSEP